MNFKKSSKLSQKGMTLIEILIVLGIIAGITTTVLGSYGLSTSAKMRQESRRLVTLIRYVYNEASVNNSYYRIVFNLDDQNYLVESSDKPFYIIKADDKAEETRKKNEERNSKDEDATPTTSPTFSETENDSFEIFKVNNGLKISDIQMAHQEEKQTEGKAELYFFPRGLTEFAVIHLSDEDDEQFRTLVINPLTADVEVLGEYKEYEELLDETE